jgi:hypothetical protein
VNKELEITSGVNMLLYFHAPRLRTEVIDGCNTGLNTDQYTVSDIKIIAVAQVPVLRSLFRFVI